MDSDEGKTSGELLEELSRLRRRIADLEAIIADNRRTDEAVQASQTRYRRLFESARDGILILDADTLLIADVNPYLTEMLGFSRAEFLGRALWEIESFKGVDLSKAELLSNGYVRYEDLSLKTRGGRHFEVEIVSNVYLVNNKKLIQYNIRDITKRRKAEEKLKYLSTHDELTGLHNRMFFDEEMCRLNRGRQFPITVIIADVDGLKQINDRLGHAVGDDLLRRAALVLKNTFRAEEVVARIGGDEFVVLLPMTDATTAERAINRVRNSLHLDNSAQTGPSLNLSLGAATAKISRSLAEALKLADERMYLEKAAHKLVGLNLSSRDVHLIFRQVDARLTASPGIHISRLASELACERHVIERAVKVVKSMQFREYQQTRRLETALRLLAEKPLLIKEIAGALGYKSPTSLWRLFKTRMRKSPSVLRALKKGRSVSTGADGGSFPASGDPVQLRFNLPKA